MKIYFGMNSLRITPCIPKEWKEYSIKYRYGSSIYNITVKNKNGKNIMLLGLDVLPEYRGQGLAREIMERYLAREKGQGRKRVVLTCLDEKVKMYERMGYKDLGISASVWGGEKWHDMEYVFGLQE